MFVTKLTKYYRVNFIGYFLSLITYILFRFIFYLVFFSAKETVVVH